MSDVSVGADGRRVTGAARDLLTRTVWGVVCLQEQAELAAAGHNAEFLAAAGQATLDTVSSILRRLAPKDWVDGQVRPAQRLVVALS